MKDCYEISDLQNIRRNPYAEYLKKNGHTTIIYTAPKDYDEGMDTILDEDLEKEAM